MRFGIVYYKDDPCANNIIARLKEIAFLPQVPILALNKKILFFNLYRDKVPLLKDMDFLIIPSTHSSEKNFRSMCIHAPGNWRSAQLGGISGKVCPTSAFLLKYLFLKLNEIAKDEKLKDYNLTLEATHHGPFSDIPCCFVEIGSSEKEWQDKKAAKIMAKTILSLLDFDSSKKNWIPVIGIGGPHYAPNFNKIQLTTNYAIGHIIPQYVFPVNKAIIMEAETKTTENIQEALIDWKGIRRSEDRNSLLKYLEELGLNFKKTKDLKK